MKVLIQRVLKAKVMVDEIVVGKINQGYLLFVGIEKKDTKETVIKMAEKVTNIRINEDSEGKTNLSLLDVCGEILSVSQFTLCAIADGRRPSFDNAANKDIAKEYWESFNEELTKKGFKVEKGIFQAHMVVDITNNGPFTIMLEN